MQIVTTNQELRAAMQQARGQGHVVGFVPTMGALHAGHLSLVQLAKQQSGFVVMSIFVNPLQFNNPADLEKYPRTLENDAVLAKQAGVDLVYAPTVLEVYPRPPTGSQDVLGRTRILAGSAASVLEGPSRPGHFDGVTTVVGMLFNLVQPDCAVFGEKDFQQLRVIEQMVQELHIPVRIIPGPTLRDPDGLAMSSRNTRLTAAQRQRALAIPRALRWAQEQAQGGARNAHSIMEGVQNRLQGEGSLKVDYVAVVDSDTLAQHTEITTKSRILVAAFADQIRLIDNAALFGAQLEIG
ncbi:MAG: pantoate--beta-alanine ligase [Proteobacteria bacterium]|nr:pantoate--beta-alanine ligase [Pseudomonadota bacterium]